MPRGKMKDAKKGIIIGLIIGLIIGGISGYFVHNSINRGFIQGRGNSQIDENTKNEITSFFDSTSNTSEINSYCEQNIMNCMYYCRSINPNNEICKEIMNSSRMGGRQWNP
jgi:hypothetical protein